MSKSGRYRFGFNGQEMDNEIKGTGNHYDLTFRGYDPRIGKFFSTDPLAGYFPWNSPYSFAENRPIDGVDFEGKEFRKAPGLFYTGGIYSGTNTKITKPSGFLVLKLAQKNIPGYYKMLNVQDVDGLGQAVQNTQFKLKPFKTDDGPATNATSAKAGAATELLKLYVEGTQEVKASEEVATQAYQLSMSIILVDKAKAQGLIPAQFVDDSQFYADLANYIFDESKAQGVGPKADAYNKIISRLGKEIFDHKGSILNNNYKRKSEYEAIRQPNGLDMQLPLIIEEKIGIDQLTELIKSYNQTSGGCVNCTTLKSAE